jgi:hypothetical protein
VNVLENAQETVDSLNEALTRATFAVTALNHNVGMFRDLVRAMMGTLKMVKRGHRKECPDLPPDPEFAEHCGCGCDEVNMHIERMAWSIINQFGKICGEDPTPWDHAKVWTDTEIA